MLDSVQKIVDLLKNFVLLIAIGIGLFYGVGVIQKVSSDVKGGSAVVTDLNIGAKGVDIKLEQVKKTLTSALDGAAKTEGKKDSPASPQSDKIAEALQTLNTILPSDQNSATTANARPSGSPSLAKSAPRPAQSQIWIYLGIEKSGQWNPNYFGLTGQPKVGMSITAKSNVYERSSKPIYVDAINDWKLGEVVGVLSSGTTVTIEELEPIEADNGGSNWWARISAK